MFREMRRGDRSLSSSETSDVLTKANYGILSMNVENDYAYGVPMSYVYTGAIIYLHSALDGAKLTNLRNNNQVCFSVVGDAYPLTEEFSMRYVSAIVFGLASEVESDDEKLEALMAMIEKYATTADYLEKGKAYALNALQKTAVIRIDIQHMTGKSRK